MSVETSPTNARRPIALLRRTDVIVSQQVERGQPIWLLKNPWSASYFRFPESDYFVWKQLDGSVTLEDLHERLQQRFPGCGGTSDELIQTLTQLQGTDLVYTSAAANKARGTKPSAEPPAAEKSLGSLLSLRLPGINPDAFLDRVVPWLSWLYSPVIVGLSLLLMASAFLLILVHFQEFYARLPQAKNFFTPANMPWLVATLLITKMAHELGHAITCKYFGGRVPELGVLLLMGAPCLYCNTSDAWMLAGKWRRIAIAAAGMYVELVLTALATWIWWFSEPGLLQTICLSVMGICAAGTLLINANPLVRYDGYYLLSDWLEIPNLRQRASTVLRNALTMLFFGARPHDPSVRSTTEWLGLLTYAILSIAYRVLMAFGLVWCFEKISEPYQCETLARAGAVLVMFSLVVLPTVRSVRQLFGSASGGLFGWLRAAAVVTAGGWLAWTGVNLPIPSHVHSSCYLEWGNAQTVYVPAPGYLEETHLIDGEAVAKGVKLAQLASPELTRQLSDLEQQATAQAAKIAQLQQERYRDPAAHARLPAAQESLHDLQSRCKELKHQLEQLAVVAPRGGVVFAPVRRPPQRPGTAKLATWSGVPWSEENIGVPLEPGVVLCSLGDPRCVHAQLVIDQKEIEGLRVGQPVELLLNAFPEQIWKGEIDEIAQLDVQSVPTALSNKNGGRVATETLPDGTEAPISKSYRAQVRLYDADARLRAGLTGVARVRLGERSWLAYCERQFQQSFHFQW